MQYDKYQSNYRIKSNPLFHQKGCGAPDMGTSLLLNCIAIQ